MQLSEEQCSCLTYEHFYVTDWRLEQVTAAPCYGWDDEDDESAVAWLAGSTFIHQLSESDPEALAPSKRCRELDGVPNSVSETGSPFACCRYITHDRYSAFLNKVKTKAAISIIGATLAKGSPFGSPHFSKVARRVGRCLGERDGHGIMATGSYRGYRGTMSFDADVTSGWLQTAELQGCVAVHFKGANMVMLHGQLPLGCC